MIGQILNKTFGNFYVKNMHNSIDRMNSFKNSAENVGLSYIRVEAIDGTKFVDKDFSIDHGRCHITYPSSAGFWGNQLTSQFILMQEISIGSQSFIISDDDSCFNDKFSYIDSNTLILPDNWDIIILGGINRYTHNSQDVSFNRLFNPSEAAGSHAVAIRSTVYDELLTIFSDQKIWGDGCIAELIRRDHNVYMVSPEFIYQDRTLYSDLNKIYHKD